MRDWLEIITSFLRLWPQKATKVWPSKEERCLFNNSHPGASTSCLFVKTLKQGFKVMLVLANGLEVYYTIFNYCLLSQQGYPVMIILVMGLESLILFIYRSFYLLPVFTTRFQVKIVLVNG